MKPLRTSKIHCLTALTFWFGFFVFNVSAQNVGINNTGAAPDASALLDLSASNKGFLITRVDTANIPSPAFGLMTLSPIDTCLYQYNGLKWVGLGGGGSNCSCNCSNSGSPTPIFPCGGTVMPFVDVTSPTGKIWMDRNLGANQVATSPTDAASYGDLYQWGRCSDGHEKRMSSTTGTLSTTDTPGHGLFIVISGASPWDWRNPQNDNLWQGAVGINNPCPTGYRLPTDLEIDAERLSWITSDAAGAFASPLKLSMGGVRSSNGTVNSEGAGGFYWSSTVSALSARCLIFNTGTAYMNTASRVGGVSIRCIKE